MTFDIKVLLKKGITTEPLWANPIHAGLQRLV